MKKLLLIFAIAIIASACSSDKDEPTLPKQTLNDLDLSKVEALVGTWVLEEEGVMPQDMTLTINSDGTTLRKTSAYTIPGKYTFANGTLTVVESLVTPTTWKYVFSHYNEYRLKVVVTMNGIESLPSTYLAYPYEK